MFPSRVRTLKMLNDAGVEFKRGNYDQALLLLEKYLSENPHSAGTGKFQSTLRQRVENNILTIKHLMHKSTNFEYQLQNGNMNYNKISKFNHLVTSNNDQDALKLISEIYTGLEPYLLNIESNKSINNGEIKTDHARLLKHLEIIEKFKVESYSTLGNLKDDSEYSYYYYHNLAYLMQQDGLEYAAEIFYNKSLEHKR